MNGVRDNRQGLGSRAPGRWYLTPFVLLFISTAIYFSPYFIGSFDYVLPGGLRQKVAYSSAVGGAVAVVLLLLGLGAIFVGRRGKCVIPIPKGSGIEAVVLGALIALTGAYVVISGNATLIDKQELLENTNRIDLSFYLFCCLGIVFCALNGFRKHKFLLLLSTIGLLFIVYLGHRSSLAIAIIGAAYVKFRDHPIPRIPLRYFVFALAAMLVIAVYKSVYIAVKMERWDLVVERLSPGNFVDSIMVGMEQFTTFAHLDFIVSENYRFACSDAWLAPLAILPYSDFIISRFWDVNSCSYNAQVQPLFFAGYSGGVAANIWAEFFGYFGYFGFPILILVLGVLYRMIEGAIRRIRSPILISGLIVALVNLSFYIQRKEFLGAFVSAKRAFTVALIVFVAATLIRSLNRKVAVVH